MSNVAQLAFKLKSNDEQAFTELYYFFESKLFHFANSIVKSPELADDIVQEVFIKVWEKRAEIDPEKSFQAFVFTITRNCCLNLINRASTDAAVRQEIFLFTRHEEYSTEDFLEFKETDSILKEAIAKLPSQQKKIFELVKIEGFTYEEAATALSISPGTVNSQIVKSLRQIRHHMNLYGRLTTK